MVCIYCNGETNVINSREQKRLNQVWRRRNCLKCGAIFTTTESATHEQAFVVTSQAKHLKPFSRDKLFLSIYESVKHRITALSDATALTDTIIAKLLPKAKASTLQRADIINITEQTLKHFDSPAAVHYAAYHKT